MIWNRLREGSGTELTGNFLNVIFVPVLHTDTILLLLLLLEIVKKIKPWYTPTVRGLIALNCCEPHNFYIYNQNDKVLKAKQMTLSWNQWDLMKHNEEAGRIYSRAAFFSRTEPSSSCF